MAEKDPLNASYFMVDVPGVTNAHFREASGFTTETNVITTAMVGKDGKTVQKQIPGIMKLSPITFKRGLSDNMDLWKWRKLVEEGHPFRQLLDRVRQDVCALYQMDGTRSLSEIALLLGFSDLSAFSRSYKRWHGVAPSLDSGKSDDNRGENGGVGSHLRTGL